MFIQWQQVVQLQQEHRQDLLSEFELHPGGGSGKLEFQTCGKDKVYNTKPATIWPCPVR